MVNGNQKLSGISSVCTTSAADIYSTYITRSARFQENYTNSVYENDGEMLDLLPNGRNLAMSAFAACNAFRIKTIPMGRPASAECPKMT